MSRNETLLALAAVIFASVSALQVPGRLIFAGIAIVLLLTVAGARLRAAVAARRAPPPDFDPGERARRIREERRRRIDG